MYYSTFIVNERGAEILQNLFNDFYIELENKRKKKLKRNVRKTKK